MTKRREELKGSLAELREDTSYIHSASEHVQRSLSGRLTDKLDRLTVKAYCLTPGVLGYYWLKPNGEFRVCQSLSETAYFLLRGESSLRNTNRGELRLNSSTIFAAASKSIGIFSSGDMLDIICARQPTREQLIAIQNASLSVRDIHFSIFDVKDERVVWGYGLREFKDFSRSLEI